MLVRELMALLAEEHPDSPITVEGLCPHGDYLIQDDLEVSHDEGPATDIEEVSLLWTASPEAERLYREKQEAAPAEAVRMLP
jgi:hypothetical protein